jgi:hypothetical protein
MGGFTQDHGYVGRLQGGRDGPAVRALHVVRQQQATTRSW